MDCSKKTLRRKLDLLLRTGQILMESSADTSRVKRNMERTAAYLGLPKENLHMNIDYYMLQVNVSDEYHSFSKMQRCDKHVIKYACYSGSFKTLMACYSKGLFVRQV